ncbi:serine threonine phosphatase [Babesia ovata]|uniref:Serine threonine phosphatase n=1 Tax=Babesia ovata TaxID=189622 RepID=A0A2H6KG93_9APIC|nr:serine threonine phosphatase [Babesia ovata]GBE62018.1 serine threonine phosphatase [Babesia ovata]
MDVPEDAGNPVIAEAQQLADEKRLEGNRHFADGDYPGAIELYTRAIQLIRNAVEAHAGAMNGSGEGSTASLYAQTNIHQLYTNRALCHARMENYGLTVLDADIAIQMQPGYSKAYYRRGCAYLCLMKFKEAEKGEII